MNRKLQVYRLHYVDDNGHKRYSYYFYRDEAEAFMKAAGLDPCDVLITEHHVTPTPDGMLALLNRDINALIGGDK